QPISNGWKSHLCGSSESESANSSPRNTERPCSHRTADAPYDPSTCNHICSCLHSLAVSINGSTAPVFVAPAFATTQKGTRPAARSAVTLCSSCATERRNESSEGNLQTCVVSNPST